MLVTVLSFINTCYKRTQSIAKNIFNNLQHKIILTVKTNENHST